ncbi:MAG: 2-phosphosulfolactate phosphatase [Candidatus Limnocylindrus sp.]
MNSIITIFSPQLYSLHAHEDAIVVVVDVLRATSAICTAIHHGVARMIPVASLEEAFMSYYGNSTRNTVQMAPEVATPLSRTRRAPAKRTATTRKVTKRPAAKRRVAKRKGSR